MSVSLPSVRPPQQERSRASLERVLDAATELLETQGYEGFTLAEVSRRANVSIGSIYTRVESKDALFHAVHDRFMAKKVQAFDERFGDAARWAQLPTPELVRQAVRELARIFRLSMPLLRVIMHRGAVDDAIAALGSATATHHGMEFQRLLLTRRTEIAHSNPELGTDVCWRIAYSTLARQVMYGPTFESDREIEWADLVEEIADACVAYLLAEA